MHTTKLLAALSATLVTVCACGPSWQESKADGYKLITQKKGATLGYQEGLADVLDGFRNIDFGDLAFTLEYLERPFQSLAQILEHT